MLFSIFTGVYAMKDFPQNYYGDYYFFISKFFAMLFRGTMDNLDYDENLDRYNIKTKYYPNKMYNNYKNRYQYDDYYNCDISLEEHSGRFFFIMV